MHGGDVYEMKIITIRLCVQVTEDLQEEIENKPQVEPYLLCCGDLSEPDQLYLVDKAILCEVEIRDAVYALLSAFFVFNIRYPPGCSNVYAFFEAALLGLKGKPPPSVAHFMAALDAVATEM